MAQVEMFDESIQVKEEPKVLPYDSLTNMRTLRYGTKDMSLDEIGEVLRLVHIIKSLERCRKMWEKDFMEE